MSQDPGFPSLFLSYAVDLFFKKFVGAYRLCDFYFRSICLQKSWCLKSLVCLTPLHLFIKTI